MRNLWMPVWYVGTYVARKKNRSHDGGVGLSTSRGVIVTSDRSDRGVGGLLKGLCVHVMISQKKSSRCLCVGCGGEVPPAVYSYDTFCFQGIRGVTESLIQFSRNLLTYQGN